MMKMLEPYKRRKLFLVDICQITCFRCVQPNFYWSPIPIYGMLVSGMTKIANTLIPDIDNDQLTAHPPFCCIR